MPPTDPCAAFTNKRLSEAKEPRVKDVGTHLTTMDELQPLLQKYAEGMLAFHDTMPIQKHCQREIVAWLHMDTGNHTKAINEDAAMASLLRDNQSIVNSETLVDVVKCEKDSQNRTLRWGIASDKALRQLQGATLKLRIPASGKCKGTTLIPFKLGLPNALDGFYMDIPLGLQGVLEERLLFDTMHRLEPRFLCGMYTSVSATSGCPDSVTGSTFSGPRFPQPCFRKDVWLRNSSFVVGACESTAVAGFIETSVLLVSISTPPELPQLLYGAMSGPPVHDDVWLRLLFHILLVNCRFAYLQVERPDAICCTYGCVQVESQRHAFHECATIITVWTFHQDAWSRFGVSFSWLAISDFDRFSVNANGDRLKDALKTLWTLLTAATLHFIWTQHNLVQYDDAGALPRRAWTELSFLGWMASVRRWLRLQDPNYPIRSSALDVLRVQGGYHALWTKYHNSLLHWVSEWECLVLAVRILTPALSCS
ncbi:Aste57867_2386 [Aphanomyces stellatus]|uniref:Aste57867_2386 protein n=1 Tax=Aphanomyces stellatus TaxID=120398 RepID=A0A485K8W7_9STRA|nr:hypothetical protein As57867_002380 [Aphanomyces stellatus]VFT79587.1 Aste57867_2386 [Aphanomyces stellatus]